MLAKTTAGERARMTLRDVFKRKRMWRACLIVVAGGLFLTFVSLFDSSRLQFWLSTLTGNWAPPTVNGSVYPLEYAFSALIAMAVNWSPLIAAFALIYRYLKPLLVLTEEESMKLKEAYAVVEAATKAALYSKFGNDDETMAKINEAFSQGRENSETLLVAGFGKNAANIFSNAQTRELG